MLHRKLVAAARHQNYRDDLVQWFATQEHILKTKSLVMGHVSRTNDERLTTKDEL